MAVGRISGPLLKANLLRDGVNLAFETDLLYLDVVNGRIGIKTVSPSHDLHVVGTTRTTNLEVTNQADIATFTVLGDVISSTSPTITLQPNGINPVVYQGTIVTGLLQLSTNVIETTGIDTDLVIQTTGTGKVNVNADMLVTGNLHTTGNITADGDITIGDQNTDNIIFNADVASNIRPNTNNFYDLGSDPGDLAGSNPLATGQAWQTTYSHDLITSNIYADQIFVNGIDLRLPQGKIYYVAVNGNDSNAGVHENNPLASVKYALSLATSGDAVFIYPGTYTEVFPLTIPVGVTVRGSGIRAVTIQPTIGTIDKDAFLLNGETTIEDLNITGFRFNGTNNTGYGFRFANNFLVTTKSPYIRNVSVITKGSVTSVSDPYGFDSNDAGKGALADGSVANSSSKEASMLFHSVTFITPNQETVSATNGVRIEWLNSFTYFADKGLYAYSSSTGFAGVGNTRLRIDIKTGTWSVGNTLTYYDTDGTTVLGTGTIASIDGNYVNLTGKQVGFETITDRATKTTFANGGAKLSTSIKKFGTASLALDGIGDFVVVPSQPDFNFGGDSFCLEAWIYNTINPSANQILFDFRTTTPSWAPTFYLQSSTNTLRFVSNGGVLVESVESIPLNTWTHVALACNGTSTRIFINGTQSGPTYTDNNTYIQGPLTLGARFDGTTAFYGYIDDVRISKGVPRYTSNFTVPASALTGDNSTVLLLHFNGPNNSTIFLDDGVTLQDLRITNGGPTIGTASLINFADYSDFGAEVRSIGSANIYGNYGAYGDGDGIIVYLVSQNFAYVGSGKLSTNDPNDTIATNEVVELNRAKIYYTSVDNEGNFKVGDSFYVNQKTGEILFNNQSLSITAPEGVVFTDGIHTTTILPTNIDTGNIRISGNTIESLTGDVNVTAASGAINLKNNTYITGNLDVTGDITLGGNIQIGDQSTDTIDFVGNIQSDLVPATNAFYNLGSLLPELRWKNIYLNRAEVDGLVIDSNTISTTISNDDLILIANGIGRIYIPESDVQIDQNLTVTQDLTVTSGTTYLKNVGITGTITQTGDIEQTGNFTTSGNTQVTGNITGTGYLQLPVITISGNTVQTTVADTNLVLTANGTGNVVFEGLKVQDNNIQSTVLNSNIVLTPQGTGSVVVNSNQSLIVPVGTTAQRPASPSNGMVRYNTDTSRYEARANGYWIKLGGIEDVSGNTRILAEATPGENNNILYFYSNNNLMATIDSTKLFAERVHTNNLDIYDNIITTLLPDSDINLTTAGTGGVKIGNLRIRNNTITNVSSGAITEFVQSGVGYVKLAGTNGVVIPSGDSQNDRPAFKEAGMMRFNTELQLVEIWTGTVWTSVAGTAAGINASEATDIGIQMVLTLG